MPNETVIKTIIIRGSAEGVAQVTSDVTKLAGSMENVTVVSERQAKSTLSVEAAYKRLQTQYDATFKAQQQLAQVQNTLTQAQAQGLVTQQRAAQLMQQAIVSVNQAQLRANASAQQGTVAAQQNANAQTQVANSSKLARYELINLSRQIQDVGVSLASGQSALTVFVQQGSQIADVFASSQGTLKGFASQVVSGLATIFQPLRIAAGGILALGAAAITAAAQWGSAQRDIILALEGIGKASGVTVEDINRLAQTGTRGGFGGFSVSEAREFATTLAATGKIGVDQLQPLIDIGKDLSRIYGIDVPAAAKMLAQTFSGDLAKGALELNQRLGIFNDATVETIRRLQATGREAEALNIIIGKIDASLQGTSQVISTSSRFWTELGNKISDAWDAFGRFASRLTGIGFIQGLNDRLKELEDQIDLTQAALARPEARTMLGGIERLQERLATFKEAWAEVKKQIDEYTKSQQRAQQARDSFAAGAQIRAAIPEVISKETLDTQLKGLEEIKRSIIAGQKTIEDTDRSWEDLEQSIRDTSALQKAFLTTAQQITQAHELTSKALSAITPEQKAQVVYEQALAQYSRDRATASQATALAEQARKNALKESAISAVQTAIPDVVQRQTLETQLNTIRQLKKEFLEGKQAIGEYPLTWRQIEQAEKDAEAALKGFLTTTQQVTESNRIALKAAEALTPQAKAQVAYEQALLQYKKDISTAANAEALAEGARAVSLRQSAVALSQAAKQRELSSKQSVETAQLELRVMGETTAKQQEQILNLQARHQLEQLALSQGRDRLNEIEEAELKRVAVNNKLLGVLKQQIELMQQLAQFTSEFLNTFIQGMVRGEGATKSLQSALMALGTSITSTAIKNLGESLVGSLGKGFTGAAATAGGASLFGGLFGGGQQQQKTPELGIEGALPTLGSFLPGGPITGAAIGIGISLLSKMFDKSGKEAEEAAKAQQILAYQQQQAAATAKALADAQAEATRAAEEAMRIADEQAKREIERQIEIGRRREDLQDRIIRASLHGDESLQAQLILFERQANKERNEEAARGGENLAYLEQALALERANIVKDYNDKLIEEEKRAAQERLDAVKSATQDIVKYLQSLLVGPEGGLSPFRRLQEAQRLYNEQLKLAQAGDLNALRTITQFAESYRAAARAFFGSSVGYQNALQTIQGQLGSIAAAPMQQGGTIVGGIPGMDSVPILGMPGEFIVQAQVAQRNLAQLTQLNRTGVWGGAANDNYLMIMERLNQNIVFMLAQLTRRVAGLEDAFVRALALQTRELNSQTRLAEQNPAKKVA